jgi:hypothetical protein
MERVIGIVERGERCALAEPLHRGLQERQIGQLVARALQKEHRQIDV